ncbi:hypothetical protein L6452_14892 [Arctium lappa]|uniref:Uncharacterized protein n=1 Tax=Arctium lappa TaxID=4217 RepID=A0ACB9CMD5_ARCLA|nr:hypothetical protein L6452_14892 [Arctium lappa]
MTSSLEENIFSQKSDSISNFSSDFKENKKEVSNFKILSQNSSDSEASSSISKARTVFFDKVSSSDSIIDNSLLLNDQFYKKKRKRRISKKSKKHDSVLTENYNVSDSHSSDRTVRESPRQIWRKKRLSEESIVDGDKYVDKLYYSDSFASCNKISKYSRKQMFRISKYVSCSSSDSNSDDHAFSSDGCDYFSDNIPRALNVKSNNYFPIRTATNKHGPKFKFKFKWVTKSLSDSKLQAALVKGEVSSKGCLTPSPLRPTGLGVADPNPAIGFALHTWPAKLVLRIKHDTQTLLCISSMARKPCFASPMWNANLSLRFLYGTQTTPVFSVSLILQIFRCLVSNIRMTKLIKIIKVMRGRSQGEVKETKSLNVYLLIKIRSKILFSQLQQNLLLFLLRTLQFIQDHSKEVYRLELKQQRKFHYSRC